VATLEPTLRQPPEWAVWAPDDAAVDSVGVTERLVACARARDARVHLDTAVTAVHRDAAGRVAGIETAAGPPRRCGRGVSSRCRYGRAGRDGRRARPGRAVTVPARPATAAAEHGTKPTWRPAPVDRAARGSTGTLLDRRLPR